MRNKYYLERKIILSHQRVHEIFEKEVRRNADEIAVEFQEIAYLSSIKSTS